MESIGLLLLVLLLLLWVSPLFVIFGFYWNMMSKSEKLNVFIIEIFGILVISASMLGEIYG